VLTYWPRCILQAPHRTVSRTALAILDPPECEFSPKRDDG